MTRTSTKAGKEDMTEQAVAAPTQAQTKCTSHKSKSASKSFLTVTMETVKEATNQAVTAVSDLVEDIMMAPINKISTPQVRYEYSYPFSPWKILYSIDPHSDKSFSDSLLTLCTLDKTKADRRRLIGSSKIWTDKTDGLLDYNMAQRFYQEHERGPLHQLNMIYLAISRNPSAFMNLVMPIQTTRTSSTAKQDRPNNQ